ncbi:MAG: RNA methyltransferase [Oscillospiraceae bacterium]|nr:RNA methyltransferase [Oscillospiraceae bacterium]
MIITSRKNEIVLKYKKLIADKKERLRFAAFVCEGFKLSEDALSCGVMPLSAVFTDFAVKKYADFYKKVAKLCKLTVISNDLGEYISDTTTPQGVFLEFHMREKPEISGKLIADAKKLLLLDHIQDSGNMGTIIRTAEALGMDAVIFTPDCPDIYSGKVLRGSMGSVFRLNLIPADLVSAVKTLKENGFSVHSCVLDDDAKRPDEINFNRKSAIIIGNEARGVSPQITDLADEKIYIPIEKIQSLNAAVAAAILMWEFKRGS